MGDSSFILPNKTENARFLIRTKVRHVAREISSHGVRVMPPKKRKQPDEKYPLKLTMKQRESLVHATRLAMGLKTRIKEASDDQQFVEFTKKELEKMGEEIYTSLA